MLVLRIVTNVLPAGGGAAYLSAKYNTKVVWGWCMW